MAFAHWFEAARSSPDRSYMRGRVQDARLDLSPVTRRELVRMARYFERNDPIANRLADVWEQYTVGPSGLAFTPASSDEAWNQRWSAVWDEWCRFCDLASRHPFSTFQSLASYRWFWDGEVFILLTNGGAPNYFPRVQLIESHRVETPFSRFADEGTVIHDGVEVDGSGRPVAYHVRNSFDGGTYARIPSSNMIHVFEPSRPNQLRGMPLLTPSMVDLHDLSDLQVLEKRAAKKGASIAAVFKKKGGVLDPDEYRRQKIQVTGQTSTGATTTEDRLKHFKEITGEESIAIENGEEYEQPKNDRPGLVQQTFWDYLTARVCLGVGIPKILVFPMSMQGTVTRADLDVAASFFKSRSAVLQAAFARVYEYVLISTMYSDRRVVDPPADFRRVNVRPPRSVNVDVGRNSSAMIAELQAGIRNFNTCIGDGGDDWRVFLRQKAVERKYVHDLASEFELDPNEIASLGPGAAGAGQESAQRPATAPASQ